MQIILILYSVRNDQELYALRNNEIVRVKKQTILLLGGPKSSFRFIREYWMHKIFRFILFYYYIQLQSNIR